MVQKYTLFPTPSTLHYVPWNFVDPTFTPIDRRLRPSWRSNRWNSFSGTYRNQRSRHFTHVIMGRTNRTSEQYSEFILRRIRKVEVSFPIENESWDPTYVYNNSDLHWWGPMTDMSGDRDPGTPNDKNVQTCGQSFETIYSSEFCLESRIEMYE